MDTTLQALIMGIVQGLTEFLPISSSGHLIIVPTILGWDDAFIESGQLKDAEGRVLGKKTEAHAAAVVGDTVGDPFKDTAGPSLHVFVKLIATISLVLAPLFIR